MIIYATVLITFSKLTLKIFIKLNLFNLIFVKIAIDFSHEYVCDNKVIIYNEQVFTIRVIETIVNDYANVFIDRGITIDISKNQ